MAVVLFLSLGFVCSAQDGHHGKLVLKVDEKTIGPFAGQTSSSCLRVYLGGDVVYASRWNSAATLLDKSGQQTRPEHTVAVKQHLEEGDVSELSSFLESRAVRRLAGQFGPPHRPIDYIETNLVEIRMPNGATKRISTREFYVASLEEEARYPSTLIVLMRKIDEIEHLASSNGTPTDVPTDCQLKPAQ